MVKICILPSVCPVYVYVYTVYIYMLARKTEHSKLLVSDKWLRSDKALRALGEQTNAFEVADSFCVDLEVRQYDRCSTSKS